MAETLYTDKLLLNLPTIFDAETAFAEAQMPVQVVDGITSGTKAFTVKRTDAKVVINQYDDTIDLNSGKSRFGDITEVKYGDIDVDYQFQDATNEQMDPFTVNQDKDIAVAKRQEQTALALTDHSNQRLGKFLSDNAGLALTMSDMSPESLAKAFNAASDNFVNKKVKGNLHAWVSSSLFNAIVDMIQYKTLIGATLDVNNNNLASYKGFTLHKEAADYFAGADVAYFTAEKVILPFIGIEASRTIDNPNAMGDLMQTATRGGHYIEQENKVAVIKLSIDGTVNPATIELSQATATIKVGANKQVTATVKPDGATDKSVTYTSSDTSVATVATDGTITGVKEGAATITAKTVNGLTATVAVTITAA